MSDRTRADAVYAALLTRQGEQWVQPRVERTRRVLELLGDPQSTYRVIHVTGTNGKTSTARIAESIVRAHGLRTGLFTSPHLERFTERVMIDGEPIDDALIADAWDEITPFVDLVDGELAATGDAPLTFFELLTVLAFAAFALGASQMLRAAPSLGLADFRYVWFAIALLMGLATAGALRLDRAAGATISGKQP